MILLPRQDKVELVRELRETIQGASALILTDYRGLTVSEITALRRKLREAGADYRVVKNTLFELAAEELAEQGLGQLLVGPTAVAFLHDEPVGPAKAIADFAREHKALSIKGGFIEGRVYGADQMQALSKAPPREVLVAQMIGSIQAPISNFVGTLQSLMSNLVYTIQAVSDKKAA
ncbi:MAG TPA: 50S ribosomal protein L10 [Armatimonadota bacterium]|nr:50S ribosomal protein L10 [Armatimonadota bacterium]